MLAEYAPQYTVGGVLAANLVVAVLVLGAPLAYTLAGRDGVPNPRSFAVSAAFSLAAFAVQAGLVAVLLLNGSWSRAGLAVPVASLCWSQSQSQS